MRDRRTFATRRRFWLVCVGVVLVAISLVDVTITEPRIHVRWRNGISAAERSDREQRYGLAAGALLEGTTWRYDLQERSRENVAALVRDPVVEDTAYIDRPTFAAPEREILVTKGPAWFIVGPRPAELFQLQSLPVLLASGLMLLAARTASDRRRRALATAVLIAFAIAAYALPLHQPLRMGDSHTYIASRDHFTFYAGVRQIRYEAHLSHAILGRLDAFFGSTEDAPRRALVTLMHGATAWFVLSALLLGTVERWSPLVVRYLGLALLAPSVLLYFGYRELGHLSLNVAAFPLLARGLRQGTGHLEAGSALFGLGAAFHGFGLLSLAGALLAALGARARLRDRCWLALRVAAWGTSAYVGWFAVYVILLGLPVVTGHADNIPFRPWFTDQIASRVNDAIFSARGIRDVLFSLWVVGAPLLLLVPALWREWRDEARWALLYTAPCVIFLIVFWPIQGLGVEMDLIFAAFPALYALAWLCAHDARRTTLAAALLVTAHLAFWRIVLGLEFVNNPIG